MQKSFAEGKIKSVWTDEARVRKVREQIEFDGQQTLDRFAEAVYSSCSRSCSKTVICKFCATA